MRNHLLTLVASSLLAVGCMASGRMHTSASADISAPELVYIGPNVQVIADYHEPIFYTSSFYWRYDGGVWYRSSNHRSGWVRYTAPQVIARIERPTMYIRYRGTANAAVSSPQQPQQSPHQRNEERREEKAEQKEERREEKAEQKEERREEKAERKEDRKDAKEDRKDAKDDHKHNGKKGR